MSDQKLPLCIKLDREKRDKFKQITHDRNTTMQKVLDGFIDCYIEKPDMFYIKSVTSITINQEPVNELA